MKKHKDYLCPGEMQWSKIPGRFGDISGWKCDTCGRTLPSHVHSLQHVARPQLYVYVGPPETPYKQPCIHCKAAEAVQPTLYCQPCLDMLGQEWLKNYELGVLHSTLPAFAEATAMMGAYKSDWRTMPDQAALELHQTWKDRWNQWFDAYSLSEREVEA